PTTPSARTYRADYLVADALGVFEDGSASITVSTTDAHGDGMLDALELNRTGSFTFSGSSIPAWNAFGLYHTSSITGSVTRAAGSRFGVYSGSYSNPSRTASFSGQFELSGAYESIDYHPGSDELIWNLTQRGSTGELRTSTGRSSIQRNGIGSIAIPSFALDDIASGSVIVVHSSTLTRTGNIFRASVRVDD